MQYGSGKRQVRYAKTALTGYYVVNFSRVTTFLCCPLSPTHPVMCAATTSVGEHRDINSFLSWIATQFHATGLLRTQQLYLNQHSCIIKFITAVPEPLREKTTAVHCSCRGAGCAVVFFYLIQITYSYRTTFLEINTPHFLLRYCYLVNKKANRGICFYSSKMVRY